MRTKVYTKAQTDQNTIRRNREELTVRYFDVSHLGCLCCRCVHIQKRQPSPWYCTVHTKMDFVFYIASHLAKSKDKIIFNDIKLFMQTLTWLLSPRTLVSVWWFDKEESCVRAWRLYKYVLHVCTMLICNSNTCIVELWRAHPRIFSQGKIVQLGFFFFSLSRESLIYSYETVYINISISISYYKTKRD